MPYRIEWYLEGHIVQQEIRGDVTLEEIREMNQILLEMLDSAEGHKLHLFYSDEKLTSLSVSLPNLYKEVSFVQHPNFGWLLITKPRPNRLIEHISFTFARLTRMRYTSVQSAEIALQKICILDSAICASVDIAELGN